MTNFYRIKRRKSGSSEQQRRVGTGGAGPLEGRGLCVMGAASSQEGVAPLLQALGAVISLLAIGCRDVLQPIAEQLRVFPQQQELTQNHVGLETEPGRVRGSAQG